MVKIKDIDKHVNIWKEFPLSVDMCGIKGKK